MTRPTGRTDGGAGRGESWADRAGIVRPERVRVWEDEFQQLHVSVDAREFSPVGAARAFPVSGRADYVSFVDDEDREVVLLTRPRRLDRDSRRALEAALERMYYVARITGVYRVYEKWGVSHWEVMTDRGYAAFEVVDQEHIRRLPGGRLLIADVDGNRFEVECIDELDERSQALIHNEI